MSDHVGPFSSFITNLKKDSRFNYRNYLKKFSSLKSNLDRVNFVYKDLRKTCPNLPAFVKDVKNDVEAIKKRQEGNAFFKCEQYRGALDHYTTSISLAKSDEVLAMGYANRSAALFRLDLHAECLVDIERALQHGYPKEFEKKLHKRRAECRKDPKTKNYEPVPTIPDNEKNPLIECAKNCVEIVRKEQYGRCVVATRDIEIGEVLAIEEPFAALVTDQILVHCHHCYQLCYNLIPCNHCTRALYCSESCADGAFAEYHKYECPILRSLDSLMMDDCKKLALKMTLMAKDEMQQPSTDYTLQENEMYRSNRFKEVFNMETNVKHRQPENLLARAVLAAILFHLIKTRTNFVQDGVLENRLKETLLTLILVCGTNTVNLNEMSPKFSNYDLSCFGTSVYSFYNIFNHSCVENVVRQFHGSTMVMRAINTIKKGEQCFVIYGPNYKEYSKEWRQKFLLDFHFFTCRCQACEEDWSMGGKRRRLMDDPSCRSLVFMMSTLSILKGADVETAKQQLPQLLRKAKEAEMKYPPGEDCDFKEVLWACYNTLGNIRRI